MSKHIPNSMQMPNAVVDELMRGMSGAAFKCYALIIRKTIGWQKEEDAISISQFVEFTGLTKPTVVKACAEIVESGLVSKTEFEKSTSKYSLNLSENLTSKNSLHVKKINKCSKNSLQDDVKKFNTQNPTKPTYTKPNNNICDEGGNSEATVTDKKPKSKTQKSIKFKAQDYTIPSYIDLDLWIAFHDMRDAKKKPATEYACKLLVNSLVGWHEQGLDTKPSLELSIKNSYTDLYAPKQQTNSTQRTGNYNANNQSVNSQPTVTTITRNNANDYYSQQLEQRNSNGHGQQQDGLIDVTQ